MNTLENKIQTDLTNAIKSKDIKTANVLRSIKTAFTEFKTSPNGKKEPEDSDLLKILQKLAKQRKEVVICIRQIIDQTWQKVNMLNLRLSLSIFQRC